jgi:hypothetical protein
MEFDESKLRGYVLGMINSRFLSYKKFFHSFSYSIRETGSGVEAEVTINSKNKDKQIMLVVYYIFDQNKASFLVNNSGGLDTKKFDLWLNDSEGGTRYKNSITGLEKVTLKLNVSKNPVVIVFSAIKGNFELRFPEEFEKSPLYEKLSSLGYVK